MNVNLLRHKSIPHLVFCASAMVIGVLGWVLYDSVIESKEATRRVNHTEEVLLAIGRTNENLGRAESAQRGYVLSGSDAFLAERDELLAKGVAAAAVIVKLTADNPMQQARAHQLEELLAERVTIMKEIVARRLAEGIEVAGRLSVGEAQQASAGIYDLTEAMRREERRLLQQRSADEDRRNQGILAFLAIAGGVIAIILLPGYLGFVFQTRARERAETKLAAMAESLPGAVYQRRTNPDGSTAFEFVSKSVAKLYGIERDVLLRDSKRFWDAIHDEDKPGFLAALKHAAETLQPHRYEFRIKDPDGSTRWVSTAASLREEPDGSILWNGYWSDISEQKRMELALQEARDAAESANRAKSVFLATMSHEIRTPMNGVLGMLELLSLTRLEPAQRTTLGVVRESGKSLLRIIDDILDFSKIEAGKLEVRPEPASVATAVEAVRSIYAGNASSKGLLITCSVDPGISPALLFDPMRVRQILNNFVSNALKFTAQGRLEIRAELVGRTDAEDRVRFSVQDTGIGISPEDQARLFQPFVQAAGGTAAKFGGTGLGLTICQRLAQMMGGSIQMTSEPGVGTTVILELTLPFADPKDLPKIDPVGDRGWLDNIPNMRRMAPDSAQAQAEGTLVLLADDHPVNRELLLRQVNTLGYAAECANDGVEALEKWKSGRFGIVITDCNMPKMDGYEFAQAIRKLESAGGSDKPGGSRVPIIACTANALGGEAENCFAAGMDDYLAKPAELKDLAKKLDQWLPIPQPGASISQVSQVAPIDPAVIAGLTGGDAAVERKVLEIFQRTNAMDAAVLGQALAERDIAQVVQSVHRIKGASKTMGASALAAVCERLEHAGRAGDWSAIEADMRAFHEALACLESVYAEAECTSPS